MIKSTLKSISKRICHRQIHSFGSKPQSYYEILEVKPTSTLKEVRSQFLKKARELHPDHNPSQKAQQEFKMVKQAYETLKDPQRKYMYDTGISVQPGQQSQMHQQFTQTGRKYYENRWYQYEKAKHKDARDQFYEKRSVFIEENPLHNKIVMFVLLVVGVFGYDYYYNKTHTKEAQNIMAKQLIQNSLENKKKTIIMKKYIEARAKEHKVED